MKRRLALALTAIVVFGAASAMATNAYAHPNYASACTGCHGSSSAVQVAVTQTAVNATTASYRVTVSGGSGAVGWNVLDGTTIKASASAATGNFSVPVGKTYTVWGAYPNTGAKSVQIRPVAPSPTPTPTPSPTVTPPSTITIRRSAAVVYLPRPFILSGVLRGGALGDPVIVYVKKPGTARWSYSSLRLVYTAAGDWWYRYTPKLRGVYVFQTKFAGKATLAPSSSSILGVTVR